ncbi:MAG: hypothetical protein EXQ81_10745 [Thermoleophilia bacterium]|nr:hypothetical protein [Thermoleophilia bacterium]
MNSSHTGGGGAPCGGGSGSPRALISAQPGSSANLVGYVERGEIEPLVARTYPLDAIAQAQEDFIAKSFMGKLVLVAAGH